MTTLRLTLRMLARDWRAGELNVLALALVLAVAAMTSVSFLVDRVEQALETESHQLLGGDLLLSADHPWDDQFRREAGARRLALAESALFPSMARGPEGAQLAEVKAVSEGYPLRGRLRLTRTPHADDMEATGVPGRGEIWVDERLAAALSAPPGTAVALGRIEPRVGAILTLDPDRGVNAFALAPRLLMNLADLPATGLVVSGSRVAWRLHLAGDRDAVESYRRWAGERLGRGEKLESLDRARPEIRNVLERAQRFLRLAALLAVILAAVAVGLAAQRYMRRHLDGCAVLRCLGARESQILAIHGGEFLLLGLAATLAGGLVGYGLQAGLLGLLAGLFPQALPPPGWRPWALGLAVGAVLVAGFIVPPLLRLKSVSTLRVLRREWEGTASLSLSAYAFGIAALAALMLAVADDLRLGAVVLAGFAAAVALYAAAARLLLGLAGRVRAGAGWRYGIASLRRRRLSVTVQAVALGLGLTALLLLTVARDGLMASWRARVPDDAPNRFVINIQPDQRQAVAALFAAQGLAPPFLEPMVRGRLVAVNGRPVGPESFEDDRAKRLVDREFNLSWAGEL
ncbi:MAG: ABC transporter permease, partial [Rhodocyclaceae bacterium]|nr:ABC transporter permease [Rhodocyclaceae bacterium]